VLDTERRRQKDTDRQRTRLPELVFVAVFLEESFIRINKHEPNKWRINTFYNCTDQRVDSFPDFLILSKRERKKKISKLQCTFIRGLKRHEEFSEAVTVTSEVNKLF